jgi:DNA processing protein
MTIIPGAPFGGLNELEVRERLMALSAVTTASSTHDVAEVFARAAWSGIAEPGDRVSGLLVEVLGAAAALDLLIQRAGVDVIVGHLRDADPSVLPACDDRGGFGGGENEGIPFSDLQQAVTAGLERWSPRLNAHEALAQLERAQRFGTVLLTPGHEVWPQGLRGLEQHAPHVLWVRGTPDALASLPLSIALVGARASTGYGEHVTMEASAGLVDRGVTIVSGAAYGIDGMAHRAALASGGVTIAFLAGGVDRFYPSGHDALLHRIVASGAVISELPCGSSPTKWRFLQRNRLIAAASAATVVVEAGWRSGSLNTAGHASALGRPLGVVPGPVTSASSAGCHRLLRETDAVLVTNATEMAELISLEPSSVAEPEARESSQEQRVVDALSERSGRTAADVARRAGLSVADTQAALGLCELGGRAVLNDRGWRRSRVKAIASGLG